MSRSTKKAPDIWGLALENPDEIALALERCAAACASLAAAVRRHGAGLELLQEYPSAVAEMVAIGDTTPLIGRWGASLGTRAKNEITNRGPMAYRLVASLGPLGMGEG